MSNPMLEHKKIVIWGAGREGLAALDDLCAKGQADSLTLIDDAPKGPVRAAGRDFPVLNDPAEIEKAVSAADVLIKSPGVSLYHPLLERERGRGLIVTSLFNLWAADHPSAFVIGVTGSKGKSTTSTLLGHTLNALGKKTVVSGNIGVPITQMREKDVAFYVVETSSYQAAVMAGTVKLSILTSLFPEHLDWHRSLGRYYDDKCNLLRHSETRIVEARAFDLLKMNNIEIGPSQLYGQEQNWHFEGDALFDGAAKIGTLRNAFLTREHNESNVCGVMTALSLLGFDPAAALAAMESYQGLPHRQQELGVKSGITFVDDSISTTPQSAIAALKAYAKNPTTLIAGGFDRGIDYGILADYVVRNGVNAVICVGDSGKRIFEALKQGAFEKAFLVESMEGAVAKAKQETPKGGVILLSPAAPSYGLFTDFTDRARHFAAASGF